MTCLGQMAFLFTIITNTYNLCNDNHLDYDFPYNDSKTCGNQLETLSTDGSSPE